MKIFLLAGKVLTDVFGGLVLLNLLQPFASPFALLLNAAGAVVLLVHALELWLFDKRLAACANPHLARVLVMLFGIFHLAGLPAEPAHSCHVKEGCEAAQGEQQVGAKHA